MTPQHDLPPIRPGGDSHGDDGLTCKRIIVDLLIQYLEHSTDADLTAAIDAHFRLCPPCLRFLESYGSTREAVRALRYEDIPPEVSDRLRQVILKETGKSGA